MSSISKDLDLVTLINVFTVAPEDQQRMVDLLIEATESVIAKQPGYISANIHKSHRRHQGNQLRPVEKRRGLPADGEQRRGPGPYGKSRRPGYHRTATLRGHLHPSGLR